MVEVNRNLLLKTFSAGIALIFECVNAGQETY